MSAELTSSTASLAVSSGAVSSRITSKRPRAEATTWRCAATTCAGFERGSERTLVTTLTPPMPVSWTRRGSSSRPKYRWIVGRRKSQLTTSTDDPASANTAARFAVVVVFPSLGDADVIITTSGSSCAGSKSLPPGPAMVPFLDESFRPASAAAMAARAEQQARADRTVRLRHSRQGHGRGDDLAVALLDLGDLGDVGEHGERERAFGIGAGPDPPVETLQDDGEGDAEEQTEDPAQHAAGHRSAHG